MIQTKAAGWLRALLTAALLLLLLAGRVTALGETQAEDISKECTFNGYSGVNCKLTDNSYASVWVVGRSKGLAALTVEPPEGKKIGGLFIRWDDEPVALTLETQNVNGDWVTIATCEADFYAQYVKLPMVSNVRFYATEDPARVLRLEELQVLTPGELPDDIQVWEKPGDKVDLMVWVGHPDDEVLWFGGMIPYYVDQGKTVLVVCCSMNRNLRHQELLNCLWECGVRTYPIFPNYFDLCVSDPKVIFKNWKYDEMLEQFTGYLRQYKPDVLVTQDVNGEYGHGAHKAVSQIARETPDLACDHTVYPEQVEQWGTWNVKKVYIHLYEENRIRMDWSVVLKNFGGRTALEVAADGFAWHISQQNKGYAVKEGGPYDCEVFGLYRTIVGQDVEKNDLFEHIH